MKYSKPRGTNDFIGKKAADFSKLENICLEVGKLYGFNEIKTPIIEETDLFIRSMGETSDVVKKEMYDFKDKGGRDICLRPEITAPIIRAVVENKLLANTNSSLRLVGCGPVFRYDRPQSGRYRQFDQLSFEWINSTSLYDDVEVICLFNTILKTANVKNVYFEINNIGGFESRKKWIDAIRIHLENYKDQLSEISKERLNKNPLRILDDKIDGQKDFVLSSPKISEFLSEDEKNDFDLIKESLDKVNIKYVVSNSLVRGLDYYTNFVFEVKVEGISGSVGGGGRYSQLVSEMGGEDVNCIGFGLGVERVLGVLEQQNINLVEDFGVDVLVANIDESTKSIAFEIVDALRENNFSAICEYNTTKLPKHFTIAEKANAKYVLILGKKELEENKFTIKEQKTKKQYLIEKKELISFFRAEFSR